MKYKFKEAGYWLVLLVSVAVLSWLIYNAAFSACGDCGVEYLDTHVPISSLSTES